MGAISKLCIGGVGRDDGEAAEVTGHSNDLLRTTTLVGMWMIHPLYASESAVGSFEPLELGWSGGVYVVYSRKRRWFFLGVKVHVEATVRGRPNWGSDGRSAEVMAEVQPSTSRGEDAVEILREALCSGADGSTCPEFVPPSIAAESPSFLTWIWIQILTACSGGGGLSGRRMLGLASGAQQTQEEVLSRIAASKSTWSEVPGRDIHHSVSIPSPNQLSVWEELKASVPHFFCDDWAEYLELGRFIGEGGQAQIFEAKVEGIKDDLVLKVFKLEAGFSLADLKCHWPRCMRKGGEDCSESMSDQGRSFGFVFDYCEAIIIGFRCFILGATLLKDGRFAFLMWR